MHVYVRVCMRTFKGLMLSQASCLQMMAALFTWYVVHLGQKYPVDGTALCMLLFCCISIITVV